jgi:hypothetical protein
MEYGLEYELAPVARSSSRFGATMNRTSCSQFRDVAAGAQQFRPDF